jgi:hypothetical protein
MVNGKLDADLRDHIYDVWAAALKEDFTRDEIEYWRESSCAEPRGWRGPNSRLEGVGLERCRSSKRSQFSSASITVMTRTRSIWPVRSEDLAGRS